MRTFTRTVTRYFKEDDIADLTALAKRMQADWHARSEHGMDTEVFLAGTARLRMLFDTIQLCDEVIVS